VRVDVPDAEAEELMAVEQGQQLESVATFACGRLPSSPWISLRRWSIQTDVSTRITQASSVVAGAHLDSDGSAGDDLAPA